MGTRGPKASAELSIVPAAIGSDVVAIERARAPADLSDEEADEWRAVVNSMPAEDMPRMRHSDLASWCRHTVRQRHIAHLVHQVEKEDELDLDKYDQVLKMLERETRAIASLSVRLGFAYSTAYEGKKPKTPRKSLRNDW